MRWMRFLAPTRSQRRNSEQLGYTRTCHEPHGLQSRSTLLRTGVSTAAETGRVKNPFSRTRPSSTGNAQTDSLLSVVRTLGLGSLRRKIVVFTLLSLIGGLSQAVVLVVISEVAVTGVREQALNPCHRSPLHTDERDHRLVCGIGALLLPPASSAP